MSHKEPTAKKPAAKTKPRAKSKAPIIGGLIDAAAAKRAEENARRAAEDVVLNKINWQWRKFILGIMNGLPNYKAYADAYSMPTVDRDERAYKVASASATRLLENVNFRAYWREVLIEQGFNDDVADTQLLKLITDPETPYPVRRASIRDYNELKGRIIDKKSLVGDDGKSLFDEGGGFEIKVIRSGKK